MGESGGPPLRPLLRAIDHTIPVFLVSYLGITWLVWGDGSLVQAGDEGESLTGLARWLCLGWVPCALLAGCGYLLALYRGAFEPWAPGARRLLPLALLASLPLWLAASERLVHSLHDDARLHCDGRLRCRVEPGTERTAERSPKVYGDALAELARMSRETPRPQELASTQTPAALPPVMIAEARDTARESAADAETPATPTAPAPTPVAIAVPPLQAVQPVPALPSAADSADPAFPQAAGDTAELGASGRVSDATGAAADPSMPGAAAPSEAILPETAAETADPTGPEQATPPRLAEGPVEVAADGERIRTGAWVERAPNGQQLAKGRYENGKREGPWREWYPDGTPKLSATYRGGVAQGDLRCFHPNGEVERSRNELTTEDGLVLWVENRFDASGRRTERSQYENGTLQGPQRTWDSAGTLRSAGTYSSGEKHGSWMYWSEGGERTRHEVWDRGDRLLPPARRDDP